MPELIETAAEDVEVIQAPVEPDVAVGDLVEEELLIEDISIDGMCGVY